MIDDFNAFRLRILAEYGWRLALAVHGVGILNCFILGIFWEFSNEWSPAVGGGVYAMFIGIVLAFVFALNFLAFKRFEKWNQARLYLLMERLVSEENDPVDLETVLQEGATSYDEERLTLRQEAR